MPLRPQDRPKNTGKLDKPPVQKPKPLSIPIPPNITEIIVKKKDADVVVEEVKFDIKQKEVQGLNLLSKAMNYGKAVAKHVTTGRTATEEEIAARFAVCNECPFFKNNSCMKCGCKISKDPSGFKNKLAMTTEKCPIDKWSKIDQ